MNKTKILFILPSLKAGGAERVISFLTNEINSSLFDVKLLVVGYEKDSVYDVDNVDVTFLNLPRLLTAIVPLFNFIRAYKPQIVFGSIRYLNLLLGAFSYYFVKNKFVFREASVNSIMNKFASKKVNIPNFLVKFLYRRAYMVICQSEDIKKDMIKELNIDNTKLKVINNPITKVFDSVIDRNKNERIINFITIGRLSEEKGYFRILKGLSALDKKSYKYLIIGDGHLKKEIIEEARELGISENISFIKYTSNVYKYLIMSHCFLQGSYVEGFPNALLESNSVGIPVIAFNCPGGTKEIIQNKLNGYLVNNEKEFEEALKLLLEKNEFDGKKIQNYIMANYSPKLILKKYEDLFLSV